MIDPNYQGEVELLFHSETKDKYVWIIEDPLRHLLVSLCPMIKFNGKLQPNPGRTSSGPDPSRVKVWVIQAGKEPQFAEALAEGKGDIVWIVEEGSYKYEDCNCHEYFLLILCLYKYIK